MMLLINFLQQGNNTTYSLGNENTIYHPEEAIQAFMKREFETILNREKTPHDVIFIPDTFIFRDLTEKVRNVPFRLGMKALKVY